MVSSIIPSEDDLSTRARTQDERTFPSDTCTGCCGDRDERELNEGIFAMASDACRLGIGREADELRDTDDPREDEGPATGE